MAQAEKPQNIGTQQQQHNISRSNNFPEDLLQRFTSGNHFNHKLHEETEGDDIELSLGLSLNGRFGLDPKAKKLNRSSSIPDFINPTRDNNGSGFMAPMVSTDNLVRTCSLPIETEEEWRKRKKMQTLRRMEAKRKRSEKQRNLKTVKDRNNRAFEEESCEEDRIENGTLANDHQKQFVKNLDGLFGAGVEGLLLPAEVTAPLPQGSIGSQGSGSSGISESESQPVQGMNKCTELRSPVSVESLSECEQKLPKKSGGAVENNRSNKLTVTENGAKEVVRNVLDDMPFVSTKGDGPNGKRIEGFLYRYGKGEEVRIVCVCHGSFLSPAEFVKHAGGGDVSQPLKHIVVNPSPLL